MPKKFLINICGPTAVGKTDVALYWAERLGCPILSTDSRQCYKELAIGSAPPSVEERSRVPHYFIADRSIHEPITAGEYEHFALNTLGSLYQEHDVVVAVGGSGMYIEALLFGLDPLPTDEKIKSDLENKLKDNGLDYMQQLLIAADPEYARKVDLQNSRRIIRALEVIEITGTKLSGQLNNRRKDRPFTIVNWVLTMERTLLYQRINRRVLLMINAGLEDEARCLLPHENCVSLQTVGYREWWPYFKGEYSKERTIELIQQMSRRYAKRQMTYFNRFGDASTISPDDLEGQEQSLKQSGVL